MLQVYRTASAKILFQRVFTRTMSSVQIPNGTGLEQQVLQFPIISNISPTNCVEMNSLFQFAGLDLKQGGHFAPTGGRLVNDYEMPRVTSYLKVFVLTVGMSPLI